MKKLVICLCLIILLAGCSHANEKNTVLTVGAAASMKDVLEAIGKQYEKEHHDVTLRFTFASTGTLQKQIEQGAPIDIFVSADARTFEQLQQNKTVIAEHDRPLVYNELVLIVPKDRSSLVHSLSDLTNQSIRSVAIGIPETVPAGAYARQWLQSAGLWEKLKTKYIFTKDVRQVLTYVESQNVDGGIVYRTDALASKHVHIAAVAPPPLNKQIVYKAGVVVQSKQQKAAKQWVAYLYSKQAASFFQKYGFIVPGK
ncbi:molybdate ABC transporter substrate-binding protein [Saccharococcus caldoxylosilyticus]|jgi:molybdate transport system substrate-binding protein|nr:molybdate ABC transporter substrate-binding protein [Parageobacillus caldoxylosilyticus]MBB3852223.1 molybdate transport system substrate-binding protein [Parageobacillus caldoxylosilyticus]QXJ39030.1 Molybdate-binding periplasmic protein precursor [Parageobacillus caldoxylosilyticus]GAJ39723.1 putative ABC transporter substrate-binding protein [Parageobacillus caldoxylosilyticus NBRC 107762]